MSVKWLLALAMLALAACSVQPAGVVEEGELTQSLAGSTCGVERWGVKTGTDADAASVNLTPQDTTIASLVAIPAPSTIPANNRIAPTETTVWRLTNVTLVQYKSENDSDYHMVLSDGTHSMIAEIPAPGCVGPSSPFAAAIQSARTAFDNQFTVTGSFQTANIPVTVTGAGMFDFQHGQTGVAPNAIELHSALSVCFGANCSGTASNDFNLSVTPGSATVAPGSSASFTVTTAVTSGNPQSVGLSATGLPSGVTGTFSPVTVTSGASSTLTLTASSSASPGTGTFTVVGTGSSATHPASVGVTVSGAGGGPGGTNGTFETGTLDGWTSTGTAAAVTTPAPHGGSYSALLGSATPSMNSALTQTVAVPARNPKLTFWYQVTCPDTVQYDWATVEVLSTAGAVLATPLSKTCTNSGSWVQVTQDMGAFAGQTVVLSFQNHDDNYSSDPTFTQYDDIVLAGSGGNTPPGTAITSPASGATVSGSINVTASASDGVGVTRVELYADGNLFGTLTSPPYTVAWNSAAVPNGTHALTSKAYNAAGGVGSSSPVTVTVNNRASGNVIVNGGFEGGSLAGWTSSGVTALSTTVHGGSASAQVGSTSPGTDSSLSQTFTVPSGATLSLWYQVKCPDTVQYDWATAQLTDSSGAVVATPVPKTCSNSGAWVNARVDLAAYTGQQLTLSLQNHDDNYSGDPTYTLFDDVTVAGASTGDTTPPTVNLTSPAAGSTVSGTTTVNANASDDVSVARVEFYADSTLLSTVTSAPYAAAWNTTSVGNGSHTLVAKAYDPAGNIGTSASVAVTVNNATGGHALQTVFIILMENHNWSSIKGSGSAPYINNTLLPMGSHAESYFNPSGMHPSEPNYLWLEAGTNFGILDDNSPSSNHQATSQHLVTLLQNAGVSWKSYQEGISGTSCPLTGTGLYAPKHNPMVYFDDVTGTNSATSSNCIAHVRPYTELATDLANNTVPRYVFITPNLCNDMHNSTGCATGDSVNNGDIWLSTEVPRILNSAAYRNGGALFVTWDESEGGDFPIGMIVLSPFAKGGGYSNNVSYTHSSMLRTAEEIFSVTPLLGAAANATDLGDLFTQFP